MRRGTATLLDDVDWTVEEDERWVLIGPNGAGKTTLLQVASAQLHPTAGVAGILGEVLGTVDVFDLRPRIGLTSAALADRIPRGELVQDVVVSASYGVLGRWREEYDTLDHDRAAALLAEVGAAHLVDRTFGTLSVLALDPDSPATVLVSHHVEEIPPGFTHAMLLRAGRVVAQGPLERVVTEEALSETFAMPLQLSVEDGRYAARRRTTPTAL